MDWLLVFGMYAAPSIAVNWDAVDPQESRQIEQRFKSEVESRNSAVQFISKLHQATLAPMRVQCVRTGGTLPKGAPR